MATTKNITMKQFNGTDYDTLYPKTVASQVSGIFSKEEIVSTETLSKYGLGADGTPNGVFDLLSRFNSGLGNEYVWEKSTSSVEYKYTVVNTAPYNAYTGATNQGGTVYIPYGDGFTINSTNEFVLTNRQELVFSYNGSNLTELNILAGKYFFEGNGNSGIQSKLNIIKCPIDSTVITEYGQFRMTKCEVYGNGKAVTVKTVYGYLNSPDPNAYPPAVSDGYTYTALGQLGAKVQIATGSYIGTGNAGIDSPNSLTFDFVPKLVIVGTSSGLFISSGNLIACFVWFSGVETANVYNTDNVFNLTYNTLTWYNSSNNAENQCNGSGGTFYYVAIG